MQIKENVAYDNGQAWWKRTEVRVTAVRPDRIEYDDIIGWRYGIPTLGQSHSMSRSKFEATFTNEIQFVQAF